VGNNLQRLTDQRRVVETALSILFQLELKKLPGEILSLTMADFCYKYNASIEVYHEETSREEMERAAIEEELSQSVRRSARKRFFFYYYYYCLASRPTVCLFTQRFFPSSPTVCVVGLL